jgi:predicted benzoate:H+ symporter BenE
MKQKTVALALLPALILPLVLVVFAAHSIDASVRYTVLAVYVAASLVAIGWAVSWLR